METPKPDTEFSAKKIKLLQTLERGDERFEVGATLAVRGLGETSDTPSVTKAQAKALVERKAALPA
jgi:hypothetical protein